MDKQPRGTYDWSFDEDAEVIVVKWKDNSNVCLASNFEHVHPTTTVKRYCRRAKEAISVQQPKLISSYNKSIGGVDIHGCNAAHFLQHNFMFPLGYGIYLKEKHL